MIKESTLNSFVSSNMKTLGLHHVNSEVPKVVTGHRGKRTDILAFDPATGIPIIIELKTRRDPFAVAQLEEYIRLISTKYPNLFKELNAFRQPDDFEFNYSKGIVGMVLSPDPPPSTTTNYNSTLFWARFSKDRLEKDGILQIVARKTLSLSSDVPSQLMKRPPFERLQPAQFVATAYPHLKRFVGQLDVTYLSVSDTIYPRYKHEHNYIAYYGTDTERNSAAFGFGTGSHRSEFDATFHVKVKHHSELRSLQCIKYLSALDLRLGIPRKDLIFPVRVEEKFASDSGKVAEVLPVFKELAAFAYGKARVLELQNLGIDVSSHGGLSLERFDGFNAA